MRTGVDMNSILVATKNLHKTLEITSLLGDAFEVRDLSNIPDAPDVEETGKTFLENATLKAVEISEGWDGLVLADDSGLEVDALDGRPGVRSARYAGEEASDSENNARLIEELGERGEERAAGRFRCVMVVASQGQALAHFEGKVEGELTRELRGEHGFGYDPLFIPEGFDQTFGELGSEVKNTLSHRARALEQFVQWLQSQTI